MFDLFLGIDPAYRESGNAIAIFSPQKNTIFAGNFLDLGAFYDYLRKIAYQRAEYRKVIFIENSLLQRNDCFFNMKNVHISTVWDRGVSVGKNQAISEALAITCKSLIFPFDTVREISPKEKGAKLESLEALRKYAAKYNIPNFDFKTIGCINAITQDALDAAKIALLGYLATNNATIAAAAANCDKSVKELILTGDIRQIKPVFDTVAF